ncbi:MAG: two-component system, OmpR family, sensor histidine kinase MprB, partial [Frankiales bacterium]|nr:two-component system, OmpR family, sensor histidine kinase MprB [Frankiales bacterium]
MTEITFAPVAAPKRSFWHWLRDTPLRVRLIVAAALAVVLALGGVLTTGLYEVRHELRHSVETQLDTAAAAQRLQFSGNPFGDQQSVRPAPPVPGQINAYVQLIDNTTPSVPSEGSPALPVTAADRAVAAQPAGAERLSDVTVDGQHLRMLTVAQGNDLAFQVALPLTAVDKEVHHLGLSFLLFGVIGLVVAAGLAWFVAGAALRPVRRLTSTAEEIAATRDLTHRIAETRRDELGRLASSFDSMLAALEASVGAQRQLVADASHELRTPLASLRTNVEVLHDLDKLPASMREDVIAGIVTQLEELTA